MGQQRSLDREVQEAVPMEGNEKRFVGDDNPLLWVLSLAAKPSDSLIMILLEGDSVTFSSTRYGFDKNRIATLTPQREVISVAARCILDKHVQGGLRKLRCPVT